MPIDEALGDITVEEKYNNPELKCAIIYDIGLLHMAQVFRIRKKQERNVRNCGILKEKLSILINEADCNCDYIDNRKRRIKCPMYDDCVEKEGAVDLCQ
jgi:hypothetical protein